MDSVAVAAVAAASASAIQSYNLSSRHDCILDAVA